MNFYSFIDFDVSLNLGIYSKSGFQTILKFEQSLAVFWNPKSIANLAQ
jgi:hypothetical protein